jgi:hypothetical protein
MALTGLPTANVLSDIALVQRSQDLRKEAAMTISQAIEVRLRQPESVTAEVARDVTLAGTLQREMGEAEPAKNFYVQAVSLVGLAARERVDDPDRIGPASCAVSRRVGVRRGGDALQPRVASAGSRGGTQRRGVDRHIWIHLPTCSSG